MVYMGLDEDMSPRFETDVCPVCLPSEKAGVCNEAAE